MANGAAQVDKDAGGLRRDRAFALQRHPTDVASDLSGLIPPRAAYRPVEIDGHRALGSLAAAWAETARANLASASASV
jgi:hypothetical protein